MPSDLGVQRMGFSLCARFVGIPFLHVTNRPFIPGFAFGMSHDPTDPEFCLRFVAVNIAKLAPRFPYGWPVLPD